MTRAAGGMASGAVAARRGDGRAVGSASASRVPARSAGAGPAWIAAAFWATFCLYETVFAGVTVNGLFYPFYAALAFALVALLVSGGVRIWVPAVVLQAAFLLAVLVSFVGFAEPVGFTVVQRLLAYLFALLVALQVRSLAGVRVLAGGAIATSTAVSAWVVASAVRGGFAYRGDVNVDPNVAAFFVGLGLVVAAALAAGALTSGPRRRPDGGRLALLAGPLALMTYATLLLASRGMVLALGLALAALVVHGVRRDPRQATFVLVAVLLVLGAVALPGGRGLIERFESERIESGGSRIPIWTTTLAAYREGSPRELLLGFGFDASKVVVQRSFGSITSTHNAFVQVLFEFGPLGLAAFVGLFAVVVLRAAALADPYGAMAQGTVWFLAGAAASVNAADGFLFWTALGFAFAICLWAPDRRRA